MFEVKMLGLKQSIVSACLFAYTSVWAQDNQTVDFIPGFKKGERLVYEVVETRFRQNPNGAYLTLMYDTSYMVFRVTDKNDSQTLIDFNYSDDMSNGIINIADENKYNIQRTETYKLVFDAKGEFIELSNWELFGSFLIENIKASYLRNQIDSHTLKYYYLYYHVQDNVEQAVLPRVLELFDILGETYRLETNYNLAREMLNPFGGNNLLKSCVFKT